MSMSLEEMEWSISITEEEEDQECGDVTFLIVMVYNRCMVVFAMFPCLILLEMCTGNLSSVAIYFTLESEANEDPPEFTLTCQSRGGPVTEVEWRRNGVKVEEDSNHMTSQIIVDTSNNTVYNNTLRVRGRESGTYMCNVSNNKHEYVDSASATGHKDTERVESEFNMANNEMFTLFHISCSETYKSQCYLQDTHQYFSALDIQVYTQL